MWVQWFRDDIRVESRTATAADCEQEKVGKKARVWSKLPRGHGSNGKGGIALPTTWRGTIFYKSRCNWGGLQ